MMMMKWLKSLYLIENVQCQKIFAGLDDIMMTLDDIDASKRSSTCIVPRQCKTDLGMFCLLFCRELAPIAEYQTLRTAQFRSPNSFRPPKDVSYCMCNVRVHMVYRHMHTPDKNWIGVIRRELNPVKPEPNLVILYYMILCGYITNLWPCRTQVLQSFAWPMRWLKATQTEIAKKNNEVSLGRDFSCWSP